MFINYAKESKEILESKGILSIITIIFMITITPILSFAETDSGKTVFFSDGSGVPGCETTNSCYLPHAISIGLGETVTWSNTDTFTHTATSGIVDSFAASPDGTFDSGMLSVGDSFSYTFNKEGIYNYFCVLHPWMVGLVIVDENYSAEPKYVDIQLFIDKESYTEGDTIKVFGTVSDNIDTSIGLIVTKPGGKIISVDQFTVKSDKTFETQIKIGKTFDVNGVYSIQVQYGGNNESTDLVAFEFRQLIQDTVPPLLLVPADMLIETSDQKGMRVNYSVKAIDDVDGVLQSFCNYSSGSMFQIGETIVTCQSFDNWGNSAEKSFTITIQLDSQSILIPDWVKEVATFWCNDSINDDSFIESIQYLIENNVITVPLNYDSGMVTDQNIPNWIKNNACWWSQNLISDDDFASGLEYLIEQGIIIV